VAWDSDEDDIVKRKILVVDDEAGALMLIGIMLDKGGFATVKASDAFTALDLLEQETPDLIILDVMMPEMDGITLCRRIRERPETRRIPVLMLSAKDDANSIIAGIDAGANDYLTKPILHNDLITKVRVMIDAYQAG
jgi:DNA-binding response OmpR family regulator